MARLDERQTAYALSYAAQQVSGLWSWERDTEHVEKAFDFAGMGARNGVTAALMVQAGWTDWELSAAIIEDGLREVGDSGEMVREPRAVLAEFGLQIPEQVQIRVHDSTADMRYIVVPMRPAGTGSPTRSSAPCSGTTRPDG